MGSHSHPRGARRRLAITAAIALAMHVALLPMLALLLLARGLWRLLACCTGLPVAILTARNRRDDDGEDPTPLWRRLLMAPVWIPVGLSMIMLYICRDAFAGPAWYIREEAASMCRMLRLAARGH